MRNVNVYYIKVKALYLKLSYPLNNHFLTNKRNSKSERQNLKILHSHLFGDQSYSDQPKTLRMPRYKEYKLYSGMDCTFPILFYYNAIND